MNSKNYKFSTTHIDTARNSTDDFNLFHDKNRWAEIKQNPFQGPIALGFQLLGLVSEHIRDHRTQECENKIITDHGLIYSNYQVNFARIVKPTDIASIEVKKSQLKREPQVILSNRFSLRANNALALIGYKRESQHPLILDEIDLSLFEDIQNIDDRSFINNDRFFVKHKYFNTSNGKNFLVGCLVEQSTYIDELMDKVCFPETFPLALISCALLERANKLKHDFRNNPMVYISHQHCINRELNNELKSNDKLTMLVEHNNNEDESNTETFNCYGLVNNKILFRSTLTLASLESILDK